MKASVFLYRNEKRIKVEFHYSQDRIVKLREISDSRWSRSLKTWHIPYSKEALDKLKFLFPEVEIIVGKKNESAEVKLLDEISSIEEKAEEVGQKNNGVANVSIIVSGRRIAIKLPKNESDTLFISSLKYSRWDKKNFCWLIPNYPGNLELLKKYFHERILKLEITEEIEVIGLEGESRKISKADMLVIKNKQGRLKIYFSYDKEVSKKLHSFPFSSWNKKGKYLSIPFKENYLKEIEDFAKNKNLKFIFEEEGADDNRTKRISPDGNPNYKRCPESYLLKLRELRYSEQTIKVYSYTFEEFINYFEETELALITDAMITDFLSFLVTERKVSSSYQNQSINAIKFYYERILKQDRKTYMIDRPRTEKTLPEVLNEAEVLRMINVIDNLKHKAIVLTVYSSGIRLGELINLKWKDVDSKRMQIRVVQGKGKKDRVTILSKTLLKLLRDYFKQYKPKEWMFEGVEGGQYSARSVQMIVKAAAKKAGIKKKVGVHTLRHTFATHLLENGTDLRYIQGLLGHESSRTTEIYTHITTKGFDQIVSPLDRLGL